MIKDNSPEHLKGHVGQKGTRLPSQVILAAKPAHHDGLEQQKHLIVAIISAIRRGWRIAVPLGICLFAIGAFASWNSYVPRYSASAYLRIDADDRPLIFKTADESLGRGTDFRLYKSTHQQLLTTPFVLNAALRDTQLSSLVEISSQEDVIGWLQANLKVSFPGEGEIMQVSMQTPSPTACVQIVNGVVEAFMKEVVMSERTDRLNRLNSLERVYGEAESKLRKGQVELRQLATALGTSDSESLTVVQQNTLQQFGKMAEKLGEVQFALMQAEGELKLAKDIERRKNETNSQSKSAEDSQSLTAENARSLAAAERTVDVVRLEEEISMSKAKLKYLLKDFGIAHPVVVSLVEEMELKNQLLALRVADGKQRAKLMEQQGIEPPQVLHTQGGVTYDLVALATRAQVLANQESILREKVDKLADETRQLGRSSIDVELKRSEIAGTEDVLHRVGEEIERTSVELKTSGRIKLLSPAVSAAPPVASKRLTSALAIGMFGLVAPLSLFVLWDLTRKRVVNGEGTSHSLSLPTIGTIPMVAWNPIGGPGQGSLIIRDKYNTELDEALDGLASMLLHSSESDKRQVFMIGSAMPGEGKSTVACQLAKGLAKFGKSVALVDFDLRRPSIHRYMDLPLEPGVSEFLHGNLSLEDAIQTTETANLSVMTAGDWHGNLHERCTSGRVDELFDFLRSSYDLVIVDSSPVLPVHDSRVVGKFTDGVILTLVRERSRLPEAAQACELFKSYGVPVIGTIIIGVNSQAYPAYYSPARKDREQKALVEAN